MLLAISDTEEIPVSSRGRAVGSTWAGSFGTSRLQCIEVTEPREMPLEHHVSETPQCHITDPSCLQWSKSSFATAGGQTITMSPFCLEQAHNLLRDTEHDIVSCSQLAAQNASPDQQLVSAARGQHVGNKSKCNGTDYDGLQLAKGSFATARGQQITINPLCLEKAHSLLHDTEHGLSTCSTACATGQSSVRVDDGSVVGVMENVLESKGASMKLGTDTAVHETHLGHAFESSHGVHHLDIVPFAPIDSLAAAYKEVAAQPVEFGRALPILGLQFAKRMQVARPDEASIGDFGNYMRISGRANQMTPATSAASFPSVASCHKSSQRLERVTASAGELIDLLLNPGTRCVQSPAQLAANDNLFARFHQCLLDEFGSADTSYRNRLQRFRRAWFDIQLRQLPLLDCKGLLEDHFALCTWLMQRCRAELSGRRSAFQRLCENGALGERHLVLLCSRVLLSESCEQGEQHVELSDGLYFLPAELDGHLQNLVCRGKLRPGRWLHTAMVHVMGLPAEGCDPLDLPKETRLKLSFNACRACSISAWIRPGLQQKPFPPVPLSQVRDGAGIVPFIDVIVLRVLPTVFRSWGQSRADSGCCGCKVDERSLSQECAHMEQIVAEEVHAQEVSGQVGADAVSDEVQARVAVRVLAERGTPQLPLLVLDAQSLAKCNTDWCSHVALLMLPATPEGEGPQPLDRLRITCLKTVTAGRAISDSTPRRGPVRLFTTRSTRLQRCRAIKLQHRGGRSAAGTVAVAGGGNGVVATIAPPGVALEAWFSASRSCSEKLSFGPSLPGLGPVPLPATLSGHFCDVAGVLLHISTAEASAHGAQGSARATFALYLATFGRHVCKVTVEASGPCVEEALSRASRARGTCMLFAEQQSGNASSTSLPRAVVIENATYSGFSARTNLTYLYARSLQFRFLQDQLSSKLLWPESATVNLSAVDLLQAAQVLAAAGIPLLGQEPAP